MDITLLARSVMNWPSKLIQAPETEPHPSPSGVRRNTSPPFHPKQPLSQLAAAAILDMFWATGPQIRSKRRGKRRHAEHAPQTRQGQARLHALHKMQVTKVSEALLSVKSPSPVSVRARSRCGNASPAQISA